jgi:DtxR family Mn-dependent transcriptional regulator
VRVNARQSVRAGQWHPAFEEYCEAIFELREDDLDVIQARIAERLEVSRPAVSEMIHKMAAQGLVTLDGGIALTESGRDLAEQVVRRHRLAERFLTDVLRLSWAEAHREAGKWEHVISPVVEGAIVRMLEDPTTCPHGNPIPGTDYQPGETRLLAAAAVGEQFTIIRIPEELEFADGLLDYLEQAGVMPGHSGTIVAASPDGTRTVDMNGRAVGIGAFASERIVISR